MSISMAMYQQNMSRLQHRALIVRRYTICLPGSRAAEARDQETVVPGREDNPANHPTPLHSVALTTDHIAKTGVGQGSSTGSHGNADIRMNFQVIPQVGRVRNALPSNDAPYRSHVVRRVDFPSSLYEYDQRSIELYDLQHDLRFMSKHVQNEWLSFWPCLPSEWTIPRTRQWLYMFTQWHFKHEVLHSTDSMP
ncbi:hypothetical protein BC835DRAFT_251587 [Cytidiella melzeri]|nr:hypothetical protein BC835DRAFT_251587 [Cytidiella melzeri]